MSRLHSSLSSPPLLTPRDVGFMPTSLGQLVQPLVSHSIMSDSVIPWTITHQAPLSIGLNSLQVNSFLSKPFRDLPVDSYHGTSLILLLGVAAANLILVNTYLPRLLYNPHLLAYLCSPTPCPPTSAVSFPVCFASDSFLVSLGYLLCPKH